MPNIVCETAHEAEGSVNAAAERSIFINRKSSGETAHGAEGSVNAAAERS